MRYRRVLFVVSVLVPLIASAVLLANFHETAVFAWGVPLKDFSIPIQFYQMTIPLLLILQISVMTILCILVIRLLDKLGKTIEIYWHRPREVE